MAGIFQSMLKGKQQAIAEQRQRNEDEYLHGERAYMRERRGVTDQREDTSWQDSREDRQYEVGVQRPLKTESAQLGLQSKRFAVGRQPIEAQQQDARFEQGMEAGQLANQAARFNVGRMPTVAKQQDATHGANLEGARQGNVMRSLQIGEAKRNNQISAAQQPDRLNQIKLERERQQAMQTLASVGQQFLQLGVTGRREEAAELMNRAWAEATGDEDGDAGVRVNEKGQYFLQGPDGKPLMLLGDEEGVMQYAFLFLSDSQSYMAQRQAAEQAKQAAANKAVEARAQDPRRFTQQVQRPDGSIALLDLETGQSRSATDAETGEQLRGAVDGKGGRPPARQQLAEYIFPLLEPLPGESENQRRMRAFELSNQRQDLSQDAIARQFYQSTLMSLLRNARGQRGREEAEAAAERITSEFMQRFSQGMGASGLQGAAAEFDPDEFLSNF